MATKQLSWYELKNLKADIHQLQSDVDNYHRQLKEAKVDLSRLKPGDEKYDETEDRRVKLEAGIAMFSEELETLRAQLPEEKPKEPVAVVPKKPKIELKQGDWVLAHRNKDDQRLTAAKVIAILGVGENKMFQVRFKDKFLTQIRADECRPATRINEENEIKKRKAEEEAARPKNPNVIIAEAQLKREPSLASAGPDRPAKIPRKLGSEKKLEKSRGNWNDFMSKQKKSKESMFRTGEGVNARVGFVGSGRPMTKDVARKRHVHEEIEED
ncbi:hypothetical protein EJ05DRAFT_275395 [Pseudovirgaria hyperparasitica]|uniref:Tudor domain-containing protein n=1 Tax=Pseudovirgaria hyperparasitica TaxID=470096 RepID=A0A6A6WF49_9PEZI|nr:uncharacterized protein EJ05DRAFT_275395 [Pseudovirgaria hyperparasitica]KAF2760207.1 hypothetical protein EJ05DRAFT_275395 [Pseudovirgaria hyperparasitica]